MINGRTRTLGATAAIVLILTGCAGGSVEPDNVYWVPEENKRITFGGPFQDQSTRQVRYQDRWQQVDYALYTNGSTRAEVIALAVNSGQQLALDFFLASEESGRSWTFNRDRGIEWHEARPLPGWSRQMFYRHYRLATEDRACAAFAGSWDISQDDPEKRPQQAAFGYYCGPQSESSNENQIIAVLATLRIDGFLRDNTVARPPGDALALSFARGGETNANGGNPGFPHLLARAYSVGNGRRR